MKKIILIGFDTILKDIEEGNHNVSKIYPYWVTVSKHIVDQSELNEITVKARIEIVKLISSLRNYPNHKPSENIDKSNYADVIHKDNQELIPEYGFENLRCITLELNEEDYKNFTEILKPYNPDALIAKLIELWEMPLNMTEKLYCMNCISNPEFHNKID